MNHVPTKAKTKHCSRDRHARRCLAGDHGFEETHCSDIRVKIGHL